MDQQQLMRVYGALMWSLGKVFRSPEVCRVYIGRHVYRKGGGGWGGVGGAGVSGGLVGKGSPGGSASCPLAASLLHSSSLPSCLPPASNPTRSTNPTPTNPSPCAASMRACRSVMTSTLQGAACLSGSRWGRVAGQGMLQALTTAPPLKSPPCVAATDAPIPPPPNNTVAHTAAHPPTHPPTACRKARCINKYRCTASPPPPSPHDPALLEFFVCVCFRRRTCCTTCTTSLPAPATAGSTSLSSASGEPAGSVGGVLWLGGCGWVMG